MNPENNNFNISSFCVTVKPTLFLKDSKRFWRRKKKKFFVFFFLCNKEKISWKMTQSMPIRFQEHLQVGFLGVVFKVLTNTPLNFDFNSRSTDRQKHREKFLGQIISLNQWLNRHFEKKIQARIEKKRVIFVINKCVCVC